MIIEQILISSISGIVAAIITTVVTLKIESNKKKNTKIKIINSLKEELEGNLRVINKTLAQNEKILGGFSEDEITNNQVAITDERRIYVTENIDLPIEIWINEDIDLLYPNFPKSDLINYKLALYRSKFLISRNKGFKYRPHFLSTLDSDYKELKACIEILQRSLQNLR